MGTFSLFQAEDPHNDFLTARVGKQTNRNLDLGPEKSTFMEYALKKIAREKFPPKWVVLISEASEL